MEKLSARPVDVFEEHLEAHVKQHASRLAEINAKFTSRPKKPELLVPLDIEPYEQATPEQVIAGVNAQDATVMKSLSEMERLDSKLTALTSRGPDFLAPLVLFGELSTEDERQVNLAVDGCAQLLISRSLPFLIKLARYIQAIQEAVLDALEQLNRMVSKGGVLHRAVKRLPPRLLVHRVGEALALLEGIDTVIAGNDTLLSAWTSYKDRVWSIGATCDKYGRTAEDMEVIKRHADTLDVTVFEGALLGLFNDLETPHVSRSLADAIDGVVERLLGALASRPNDYLTPPTPTQLAAVPRPARSTMAAVCLIELSVAIHTRAGTKGTLITGQTIDAGLDAVRRRPIIHLCLGESWPAAAKLIGLARRHGHPKHAVQKMAPEALVNAARDAVQKVTPAPLSTAARLAIIALDRTLRDATRDHVALMDAFLKLTALGQTVDRYIEASVTLPAASGVGIKRAIARRLANACVIRQAISGAIARRHHALAESLAIATDTVTISDDLLSDLSGSGEDVVALTVALLHAPRTRTRRTLMLHTIDLTLATMGPGADGRVDAAKTAYQKAQATHDVFARPPPALDCLYLARPVIPALAEAATTDPSAGPALVAFMAALARAAPLLSTAAHSNVLEAATSTLREMAINTIVRPLTIRLDDKIRLVAKTAVVPGVADQVDRSCCDARLLSLQPLPIMDETIDIRHEVQAAATEKLYNHITCFPADWEIYNEMRLQYREMFNVTIPDSHLPLQNKAAALDALSIMRNIHEFVGEFSYNLNQQFFIQNWEVPGKQSLVLRIEDVADSIRQHGPGMMDTAVNYTYTFLVETFRLFVEFLKDEQVLSQLARTQRKYQKLQEDANQAQDRERPGPARLEARVPFPFAMADGLGRELSAIGQDASESPLTKLRGLLTRIGNAVGYIRLLQSGALHTTSEAGQFLRPHAAAGEGAVPRAVSALRDMMGTGTVYYKSLVHVFRSVLTRDAGLAGFRLLVPSLIINHVENAVTLKDALGRVGRTSGFTQDGFVLGLAYVLACLDQTGSFDSLLWHQSVDEYLKAEVDTNDRKGQYTAGRRDKFAAEHKLFDQTYSSCVTFFEQVGDDE